MFPHNGSFAPHPLALLGGALVAGILAAHFLSIPLALLLGCAVVVTLLVVWSLHKLKPASATLFIILATLFAGAALETIERRVAPDEIKHLLNEGVIASGDPVELTGVLERPPEIAPESFYLTLRVEKIRLKQTEQNASGVIELLAPVRDQLHRAEYDSLELRYGARIRVMTRLERADNYRNPGVSSFTEYLERKGYDATGVVKSPLLIERLADRRVFLPLAWLYQWRQKLETEMKARFASETAGVLDAALLGNRYNLSHAAAERFRDGGTFHVLVISGLHISFIGGLVFLIARRITKRRLWQFILSTIVLWSYAIAVGAQVSVVRAALMFTLVALAPVVSRQARSLNSLGGAALLLLVWRPGDLFDPSFQLTFLSVLIIIVIAWPLLLKLEGIGAWRPSQETPHPPSCARWLRTFSEILFWSERQWKRELARSNYSYKLFKAPASARLERWHVQRPLRYAMSAVVISTSVQLGLLPLLIIYFHRLSLAAIVLNIGVGLLMALLGMIALFALVLAQISSTLAAPLITFANIINWLMVHSVDPFARAGIASLRLPEYAGWRSAIYLFYYVPFAFLALALARWNPMAPATARNTERRKGIRIAVVLQLILLLVILIHPLSAARPDGRLRVDFLDVGQGDAALVTMPDGTTLLIDGGGRSTFRERKTNPEDTSEQSDEDEEPPFERDTRSIGEAVVSEYLWWRGLDHVDYILVTHADADHIDGLNDVARNFKVRAAFVARAPLDDPEYQKFAETLRARAIPINMIGARDALRFGSVTANVYWPMPVADSNAPSKNNDSIVLRMQFGDRSILMTGDIEKEGEAEIVSAINDLRSDVVKVPHHGSRTSSTVSFIERTHPRLAIISVGLTSVFGHPNREIVERWRASGGAEVMTTGRRGTITVSTDGKNLTLDTFVRH
jgi:competence protein ComEC